MNHWQNFCVNLGDSDANFLLRLVRAEILCNASAFDRRVTEPLMRFPHRLLLLAKSADTTSCQLRQLVAREIVETPAQQLETNARKVKTTFASDLAIAMSEGLLVGRLRTSLRSVAVAWRADTRECERINKSLKLFTERGPNSSAELISSRAGIKHYLGEAQCAGATELRRKWSNYRPQARRLSEICLRCWADKQEVMENTERWIQPAQPRASVPSEAKLASIFSRLHPDTKPTMATSWAACFNAIVNKHLNATATTMIPVLAIGCKVVDESREHGLRSAFSYFAVAEKVRRTHRLAPCTLEGDAGAQRIVVQRPLRFSLTVDVIASFFPAVRQGSRVKIFLVPTEDAMTGMQQQHLGNLGTPMALPPTLVAVLQKPSKKTARRLEKACGGPSDGNDVGACAANADAADAARVEDDDDDDDDDADGGEAELQEGMNLLVEEIEAEGGISNGCSEEDPDGGDGDGEHALLQFALNKIGFESSMHEADEMELAASELAAQERTETCEEIAGALECRRAQEAIREGVASKPSKTQLRQMGLPECGNDEGTDELTHEAAVEAVLNQAGRRGDVDRWKLEVVGCFTLGLGGVSGGEHQVTASA